MPRKITARQENQMSSIFRSEALAHRRHRLYGEVVISETRISSLSVLIIGAVGIALMVWASLAKYSRTEIVSGVVGTTQPTIRVMAQKGGTIKKLMVKDGDLVKPGQILAIASIDTASDNGQLTAVAELATLEQQLSAVQTQLSLNNEASEKERLRLQEAIGLGQRTRLSLSSQLDLQRQVLTSTEKMLSIYEQALQHGQVSRLDYERTRQSNLQQQQQLRQIEQALTQNQAQHKQYEAQLARVPTDKASQAAELTASLKVLEGQYIRLRSNVDYEVISPITGRVTALQASVGKSVDARFPLLVLAPVDSRFFAEIYAPSRAAGFIKKGQRVRLMYDAFPYKQFGSFDGVVSEVAQTITAPADIDVPIKIEEPVYRIRVAIKEQRVMTSAGEFPLQSGMALQASIALEQRSLIDKLLEPINAIRYRT